MGSGMMEGGKKTQMKTGKGHIGIGRRTASCASSFPAHCNFLVDGFLVFEVRCR